MTILMNFFKWSVIRKIIPMTENTIRWHYMQCFVYVVFSRNHTRLEILKVSQISNPYHEGCECHWKSCANHFSRWLPSSGQRKLWRLENLHMHHLIYTRQRSTAKVAADWNEYLRTCICQNQNNNHVVCCGQMIVVASETKKLFSQRKAISYKEKSRSDFLKFRPCFRPDNWSTIARVWKHSIGCKTICS